MFTTQNAAVAASSAGTFAKDQAAELTQLASNGDFSIRILALLGAIAMVVVSVIGFLGKILTLHFVSALIEVYVFALAIVIIILESAGKIPLPRSFETNVHKYALFLKFVWGRGILYFIGGSLQVSQANILDLVVGLFMCFVGILYMIVGRSTSKKLEALKKGKYSDSTLRAEFREADVDAKGALTMAQFKNLIHSLGLDLNRREVEAAFLQLDPDSNGLVTVDQFLAWWSDTDNVDALPMGV